MRAAAATLLAGSADEREPLAAPAGETAMCDE